MKTTTNSLNNLLETLSQQGDSSAFHSLCEPYLRARYQKERNTGVAHRDASIRVLAEATELFESFITIPPRQRSAWIDEHCTIYENNGNDSEEVLLDTKIVAETAQFLRICSSELMKTASRIRKSQHAQSKNPFYRLTHSRLTLPVGISLLGLLIIGVLVTVMYTTGTVLNLTLSTRDRTFSFRIPTTERKTKPESVLSHLQLIVDTTSMASDTSDTSEAADTIPPTVEKPAPKPAVVPKPRKPVPRVVPEKRIPAPAVRQIVTPPPEPEPVSPAPTPAPPTVSPGPSDPTPVPTPPPAESPTSQNPGTESVVTPPTPSQSELLPENSEF